MNETKPQRIQLKRTKGWNLKRESMALNGLRAMKCTRPGPWGNPFKVGQMVKVNPEGRPSPWGKSERIVRDAEHAVSMYRDAIEDEVIENYLGRFEFDELMVPDSWDFAYLLKRVRGKNLACFCKPENPCHCSVLLELANPAAAKDSVLPIGGEG
jgi:hypothetical protein